MSWQPRQDISFTFQRIPCTPTDSRLLLRHFSGT